MKFCTFRYASLDALDEPRFTRAQCEALFAAVLAHDEIDREVTLPDTIHLDYSRDELFQCYRICRQMWKEDVTRQSLLDIAVKVHRDHSLGTEDQLSFRYLRANIKQMRFAYATFDERHRYPWAFDRMTRIMGRLQDALKNERQADLGFLAVGTRLFLGRIAFGLTTRKLDRIIPTSTESFRHHVGQQMDFIRTHLARADITRKAFHEMRKVVSRQVALYDNLKTLYPSPSHRRISRYLGTINGLMGGMHDEMILVKMMDSDGYYNERFQMPEEIHWRLTALVERYS